MDSFARKSLAIFAWSSLVLAAPAQAAQLLIDDFSQSTLTTDGGQALQLSLGPNDATGTISSALSLGNGTSLNNVTRYLEVSPSGSSTVPGTSATATAGFGQFTVSNDTGVDSDISLWYEFDAHDLTAGGLNTALLLEVLTIDQNTSITITLRDSAGNSVTTPQQSFTGPGTFFTLFNAFDDGANNVDETSVEFVKLDFAGPSAWDGSFQFLATNEPPTVPEPGTLALAGLGLIGMGVAAARRPRKLTA